MDNNLLLMSFRKFVLTSLISIPNNPCPNAFSPLVPARNCLLDKRHRSTLQNLLARNSTVFTGRFQGVDGVSDHHIWWQHATIHPWERQHWNSYFKSSTFTLWIVAEVCQYKGEYIPLLWIYAYYQISYLLLCRPKLSFTRWQISGKDMFNVGWYHG